MNIHIDKKLAQQIVSTVRDVCGQNVNFIDCSGVIYASTDESRIGSFHEIGRQAAATGTAIEVEADDRFTGTQKGVNLPVYHNQSIVAVIGISGPPDEVRKYAYLAERITRLLIREKELNAFARTQEERKHYVISALLGRERLNDAYLSDALTEWGIKAGGRKRMAVIRLNSRYNAQNAGMIEQELYHLFARAQIQLYTYNYPDEYLAVVDEPCFGRSAGMLEEFAAAHRGILNMGIGRGVPFGQLADSYETGLTALNSLRGADKNYAVFDELTLEIILSSVPEGSREAFLKKTVERLTKEEMDLISVYFEEDMSLSGTCSRLFLHKNTLQYRLDKIGRRSGFNPRKFRDAAVLYLAVKLQNRPGPEAASGQGR